MVEAAAHDESGPKYGAAHGERESTGREVGIESIAGRVEREDSPRRNAQPVPTVPNQTEVKEQLVFIRRPQCQGGREPE